MPHTTIVSHADPAPYAPTWRRFWRWYLASWALFLGYLPGIAVVSTRWPDRFAPGGSSLWLFLGYAALWATTLYQARAIRCPRCGARFFALRQGWRVPLLFVDRCQTCGLPKYAERDPERHAA